MNPADENRTASEDLVFQVFVPVGGAADQFPRGSALVGRSDIQDGRRIVHFVPGDTRAVNLQTIEDRVLVAAYYCRDRAFGTKSCSVAYNDLVPIGEVNIATMQLTLIDRARAAEWCGSPIASIPSFVDYDAPRREREEFRKDPIAYAMKNAARGPGQKQ